MLSVEGEWISQNSISVVGVDEMTIIALESDTEY